MFASYAWKTQKWQKNGQLAKQFFSYWSNMQNTVLIYNSENCLAH